MTKLVLVLATVACSVGLGACNRESSSPNPNLTAPPVTNTAIMTDKRVYTPTVTSTYADFNVTATYVNRQATPIYVVTCGDNLPFHSLQKYDGETWRGVDEAVGYGCTSELQLNEVAPGGEFTKAFRVLISLPYNVPGFYRLNWHSVVAQPDINAAPIAEDERVSNTIKIELP